MISGPLMAVTGLFGSAAMGGTCPGTWLAVLTAAANSGQCRESYLVRFLPGGTLRKGFAVFLGLMGTPVLFENRGAFF